MTLYVTKGDKIARAEVEIRYWNPISIGWGPDCSEVLVDKNFYTGTKISVKEYTYYIDFLKNEAIEALNLTCDGYYDDEDIWLSFPELDELEYSIYDEEFS